MLVIRMQRTGRKGHAMFRVVVQDSRRTPTSGKVVAQLGSYDPHTKNIILNKEKASFYVEHGAQPSDRVARLLKAEGVDLPKWVDLQADKERATRNADKRRSTRPPEPEAPAAEEPAATPESEVAAEAAAEEAPEVVAEPAAEAPVPEASTETDASEAAAEETAEPEAPAESTEEVAETESNAPADAPEAAPADEESADEPTDKK